jgi:hypothetical protein
MRGAEEWAGEQGCTEMASDTWIDNEAAQRAHLALGFEVVDRCVHLRKPLAPPAMRRTKKPRKKNIKAKVDTPEPSAASLREMPEVDLKDGKSKPNPYARRNLISPVK